MVFLLTEGLKRVRRVEEVGRHLAARDDVVNRNRSGQALRVGDQPLLQLQLWPGVEYELDRAGRVAGLVLERDRKRSLIALSANNARVAGEIDRIGKQQAERSGADGVLLDRLQIGVLDGKGVPVGHDAKRARRGVIESDLARPLHVEPAACVLVAGVDLIEASLQI